MGLGSIMRERCSSNVTKYVSRSNTINEAILFFSFHQWIEPYVDEHAQHFVKQIAASQATKWDKHYSETVGFVSTRLVFAIVRLICWPVPNRRSRVNGEVA